jgi:hypothetical protein
VKLFAYPRVQPWKIPCDGAELTIARFGGAREAIWDDIDPAAADYVIVPFTFKAKVPRGNGFWHLNGSDVMIPGALGDLTRDPVEERALRSRLVWRFLEAIPHYERFPDKHVFVDNGDLDRPCQLLEDSILFKVNATYRDPAVLPMLYRVPDPGEPSSIEAADLDVTFLGDVGQHPIRSWLARWSRHTKLKVEFRETETSFHSAPSEKRPEMVREAFELMLQSKFVLSPRGVGPTSRRFYEILAHGRIPIHVSDSARLPLESVIEYDRFVIRVPEGFVFLTDDYIEEFLSQHDLGVASTLARQTYEEYFAPASFRRFVELSLATR